MKNITIQSKGAADATPVKGQRISAPSERPITQADLVQLELRITERIHVSETKTTKQFGVLENKMTKQIHVSETKTTKQFAVLEKKIDGQGSFLEKKIDDQGRSLEKKIDDQGNSLRNEINEQGMTLVELASKIDNLTTSIQPFVNLYNKTLSQAVKLIIYGLATSVGFGLLWLAAQVIQLF